MGKRIIIGSLLVAALLMAAPAVAYAGWDISISIPLPGFYFYSEPALPPPAPYGPPPAVAPGPYFYGGYWYLSNGGQWFISAQAGGPWYVVGFDRVPAPVLRIPLVRGGRGHHEQPAFRPRGWLQWGGGHHDRQGGYGHGHRD